MARPSEFRACRGSPRRRRRPECCTQGLHFEKVLEMRLTVGLDEKRPRGETRVDLRVRANGPQLQSSRCLCREKAVLKGDIAKSACHFKHFPERQGVAAQQFEHSVLGGSVRGILVARYTGAQQ